MTRPAGQLTLSNWTTSPVLTDRTDTPNLGLTESVSGGTGPGAPGSASVPAGLTINAQSGVITWTPTASQVGPNPIVVTATDPDGAGTFRKETLKGGGFDL